MGFFDDLSGLKGDVSVFAKGVKEKAKGGAEIAQLNALILAAQKELGTAYATLGEKWYELNAESGDETLAVEVEAVKAVSEKLAGLKEQLEAAKTATAAVTFTQAKEEVVEEPAQVDEELAEAKAEATATEKTCPKCGAIVSADAAFCCGCGAKLV